MLYDSFGFEISSTLYNRVYIIHAASDKDMDEWVRTLNRNIAYLAAIEQSSSQDYRLEFTSAYAIHNTNNIVAMGCGTCLDLDDGALQIVSLETDAKGTRYKVEGRFGDLVEAADRAQAEVSKHPENGAAPQ